MCNSQLCYVSKTLSTRKKIFIEMAQVHHYPVLISKATVESAGGKTSFPGDWSISRKLNGKPDKLLSFCLHVLTFAYTSLPTIDLTILEFRTQWLSRESQANRWLYHFSLHCYWIGLHNCGWMWNNSTLRIYYLSSTYRFLKTCSNTGITV